MTTKEILQRLAIRDFRREDIALFAQYWYRSPPGFIEGRGVDLANLTPEPRFIEGMTAMITENAKLQKTQLRVLTVTWDNRAIGAHPISDVVAGQSGVMHAHFWDASMRGKGLGVYSVAMATSEYFTRFQLKEMIYRPARDNRMPNRVLQKLGVRFEGEGLAQDSICRKDLPTNFYRLTRPELAPLLKKLGLPAASAD